LKWWKNNKEKYPKLYLLSRRYLCIPATSVPSERVFSAAGEILSKKRSRLTPDHLDMLIFLFNNYDYLKNL
jgi:hypothetical protein